MRRIILVHGWEGYPEEGWFPWFKREMEARGFVVVVPAMEPADAPSRERWVPQLAAAVGTPDEDTYLIGHSAGCITILRYLEGLPNDTKIGGAVFVGGYTDDIGFEELKNYFTTPLDWDRMRLRSGGFIAIHSDNDQFVPLSHAGVFERELGAQTIILHERQHFDGGSGITELPEARDAMLRLARME